ncbi:uncharacterized protein PHALS_06523 [Plasmopara halstedii]|uniref:Uncharacterized protein n=1 Tax=Plasmopara halstedii TaxID=4781 RepID=A0A0P1B1U7_PLAHL|nr:uncharacterized protein PHALS_06523 [Plasmopara halstedii]CEG48710.1 hypothetical protein PHALS_06523 [Plasmopara halstedii]|eukprot:XP_024585079.1 hypothetical protein PHALS_06523 [Plasmopara halstedii]
MLGAYWMKHTGIWKIDRGEAVMTVMVVVISVQPSNFTAYVCHAYAYVSNDKGSKFDAKPSYLDFQILGAYKDELFCDGEKLT